MNDFSILKGYVVCKVRKKTLIKYVTSAFLPCYCIYCHFCHFLLAFTASATYSAHVRLASEFKITLCAYNFSYIIPFDPGDTSFESPHWELFKTGLKSDIRWFGAPPYILENFRRHSVSSALAGWFPGFRSIRINQGLPHHSNQLLCNGAITS